MKRYKFSCSTDITKNRDEIIQNFELLRNSKEVQDELYERIEKEVPLILETLSVDVQDRITSIASIMIIIEGFLYLKNLVEKEEGSVDNNEYKSYFRNVGITFSNAVEDSFKKQPFKIHYSLIFITEIFNYLETLDEQDKKRISDLIYEIEKNEDLDGDDSVAAKIDVGIQQDNRNYPLYFAYTLRQMSTLKVNDFLNHHHNLYDGNFIQFIAALLLEYKEEISFEKKTIKAVQQWLKRNEFNRAVVKKLGLKRSADEKMNIVIENLGWLKTKEADGSRILFDKDYTRLLEYTRLLVVENEIPNKVKPIIPITNLGFSGSIRYCFYLIHSEIQGYKPLNDKYIDFLHVVFPNNFKGEKMSTKKKFSVKPKKSLFNIPT